MQVGEFKEVRGGDCFVTTLILKCICLVFHGENGLNEDILIVFFKFFYVDNLIYVLIVKSAYLL